MRQIRDPGDALKDGYDQMMAKEWETDSQEHAIIRKPQAKSETPHSATIKIEKRENHE